MFVLKFGGTSVGDVHALLKVKAIVGNRPGPCVIVVSAMSGVTNRLAAIFDMAVKKGDGFEDELFLLKMSHQLVAGQILEEEKLSLFLQELELSCERLRVLLQGIAVLKDSQTGLDYVLSVGEHLSAWLVSLMLEEAVRMDSREFIITNDRFGEANILWNETSRLIREKLGNVACKVVVPGFCGSTRSGCTTTLGRGGSDLSAAMIAAALEAECLEIWTDVDGMMTADPRIEPKAITLTNLTYSEAAELCHFGAKVLYTPAIWPAVKCSIPVRIRNTFRPEVPGTRIDAVGDQGSVRPVKGISHIPEVSLITVYGDGLLGQVGVSYRLFGLLADQDINIVFISQASSEYSISFAVKSSNAECAVELLETHLLRESERGIYNQVAVEKEMAILAVVGSNMRRTPGISGKMFSTLGKYGINVAAIAQGGSELNISVVVAMRDVKRAVNVLHSAFFLGGDVVMDIYMAGRGQVGHALLEQMKKQRSYIRKHYGINLKLKGLMDSRKMLLAEGNILRMYPGEWEKNAVGTDLSAFMHRITEAQNHNSLFVDCTASGQIAAVYPTLLGNGIHVVTANKIASSSRYHKYMELLELAKRNSCSFRYETNVGAGLPVLATIEDMVKSGDRITGIEAVLSGSLNFILNKVRNGDALGKAIQKAREAGFTEPDPRVDLSGIDVKRKLLILARVAGYALEEEDISENPFLPCYLLNKESPEEFYVGVENFAEQFGERVADLSGQGKCLRYIASLRNGRAEIGLAEVAADHPFYLLDDSNNIVMIYSERYCEHPMTIRGYGAGAEVTAAGVFADIMKTVLN